MADGGEPTEAAATVPSVRDPAGEPGTDLETLRGHLPGLEPDRQVTDWGRSERIEGALDRTVYDFLYHYWFRVAVEGIENVPSDGPALIVANQAGVQLPSAAMIVKAIREEHPRPRPVHVITDPHLATLPAIGMLVAKAGGVTRHPANVHRLLFDEGQLVLGFPEADAEADADTHTPKPLKHRYRLKAFGGHIGGGMIETALEAGAPIVPVAVLGAEEALPVLGQLRRLARLTRLPAIRLGAPLALPAKFRLRFLEPVRSGGASPAQRSGGASPAQRSGGASPAQRSGAAPPAHRSADALAHDIRALIQENLLELVAERRSVWLG